MNSASLVVDRKDIELLHETFILFGDPNAPYWFLGLEEGDHPAKDVAIDGFVRHLLKKTNKYRNSEKLSLRDFCSGGEGTRFLPNFDESDAKSGKDVKYQATWGGYIKLLLSTEMFGKDKSWTIDDVKRYQKYSLGALTESELLPKSCLMELFPMARKGRKKGHWPYAPLADRQGLEFLKTPSSYQAYAEENRAKILLSLIKLHDPKYLICFGSDCKRAVLSLIDDTPQEIAIDQGKRVLKVSSVIFGKTRILFSNHPTSHGVSNLYWRNLGAALAAL